VELVRTGTYYAPFVMELATRRVRIAGMTTHPDTQWMLQMARQRTDTVDGILLGKRNLIEDSLPVSTGPSRARS
jgi:hypothetical protein